MGKGGGGGAPPNQQVTSTTTNLPEYARPYFENLLQRGQAESYRQYQPYEAERIAGFTPGQMAVQRETMGMQTPGQFGVGTGITGAGGLGSLGAGQQYFGMAVDPMQMQAFMSPYQQNVTDIAKRSAIREAQIAQQQASLGAARQGTYGGARQEIARAERERGLLDRLSGLQAEGSQKAFEAARQAQQFGANLGLQGFGQATQAGQTLGQLGTAQQAANLQRLAAQEAVGAQQRSLEQQRLDQAYADFLRQRDYPMEQLGYYSSLLRGLPMQLSSTQTTSAPPPSIASQIGGLGLGAIGLYNVAKSAGAFAEGGSVDSYASGGSVISGPSPEELHRMGSGIADKDLGAMQNRLLANASSKPADLDKLIMVAGELQARKDFREKAATPKVYDTPYIAELLTDGAMPPMPQQMAALPENAGGVAALPAPNMENMEPYTAAAGGLVAFEDGGQVARFQAGGVPLVDVLRTLNMDERRFYQQTGRLPERAQAMLTGQAPMPAAPVPNPNPATISLAADPNAPAQVPLPENMRFYPGIAGLIQGPQNLQRGISSQPGSLPADVRRADASEMASVPLPAGVAPAAGAEKPPVQKKEEGGLGGLDSIAKAQGMDYATANEQAKKMMGKELTELGDPFKDIRDEMKTASDERKADLKNSAWMRLAEFGFGMTAGTSPNALVNAGKAGVEALKGYADDLREKKKLDRDDRKMLADLKRLEVADKRDNVFKTADLTLKILGEANAQQRAELAARTQLQVANIGKTTAEAGRAEARDDRLLLQAQEMASKQVRDDPLSLNKSAAQKEAEINRLAMSYYKQALAMRAGKGAEQPAGNVLRFDAKGNPIR